MQDAAQDLAGKVTLIVGASRGIGRAVALRLATSGADVIAIGRAPEPLASLAKEIAALGRRCVPVALDVTDPAVNAALDSAAARIGAPTILVHAAASIYRHQRLQFVAADEIDRMHAVDVRSAVVLSQWAIGHMVVARFGRIVFLGSLAARMGIRGAALYATSKAALEGLARGIALDYSQRGITANVLSLGFVETERLGERLAKDPAAREKLIEGMATKRLITPGEVAHAVHFLCTDHARSITGAVLDMTGGSHLGVAL